jgi:hypothetical protein
MQTATMAKHMAAYAVLHPPCYTLSGLPEMKHALRSLSDHRLFRHLLNGS